MGKRRSIRAKTYKTKKQSHGKVKKSKSKSKKRHSIHRHRRKSTKIYYGKSVHINHRRRENKKKKTKKMQRGGDGCSVSYVDIPGFSVGPLNYSSTASPIGGLSVSGRRASLQRSCNNNMSRSKHAMTGM